MYRLYAWLTSDTRKTDVTTSGNEEISLRVNYGSKEKSVLAVRIRVTWLKIDHEPTVYVYPMSVTDVNICRNR